MPAKYNIRFMIQYGQHGIRSTCQLWRTWQEGKAWQRRESWRAAQLASGWSPQGTPEYMDSPEHIDSPAHIVGCKLGGSWNSEVPGKWDLPLQWSPPPQPPRCCGQACQESRKPQSRQRRKWENWPKKSTRHPWRLFLSRKIWQSSHKLFLLFFKDILAKYMWGVEGAVLPLVIDFACDSWWWRSCRSREAAGFPLQLPSCRRSGKIFLVVVTTRIHTWIKILKVFVTIMSRTNHCQQLLTNLSACWINHYQ